MVTERLAVIQNERGETFSVPMTLEGNRIGAVLRIDGVPHHFEWLPADDLVSDYVVDTDPDYVPRTDREGCCYLLVPFSK